MDNPETLTTFGTQDTGHSNTTQKTKKMSNTDPTNNRDEPMCSPKISNSCLL